MEKTNFIGEKGKIGYYGNNPIAVDTILCNHCVTIVKYNNITTKISRSDVKELIEQLTEWYERKI